MRILRAASGLASRCGSNALLRAIALATMVLATAWLEVRLWSWGIGYVNPGPCIVATLSSLVSVVVSLLTIAVMSDPPERWTLEKMTGYAPFVMWRALTSDGRVTGWKLLL